MFFLGIVGPIVPYLLLMGILLSFTFQGSLSSYISKATPAKTIQLKVPNLSNQESEQCDNYYYQDHRLAKSQQNEASEESDYTTFTSSISHKSQPFIFKQKFYLSEISESYFGLSPPLPLF